MIYLLQTSKYQKEECTVKDASPWANWKPLCMRSFNKLSMLQSVSLLVWEARVPRCRFLYTFSLWGYLFLMCWISEGRALFHPFRVLKSLRSWCHWKRNVRNSGFRHLFHQNRSMQTRDMANCDFKMLSKCERDAPAEIDVTSRHTFDLFGVTSASLQGAFTGQQWLSMNFIGKSCANTEDLVL